ncbi:MAG: DNA polymerase III subunit [Bacteroides sp.]|nr:DNA polymerase III subunit [Bacteroides sp.]
MFGFNEVVGHEAIKQRIKQDVLNGRMPHALMFTGPSGVGKLPMALALARYLSCPNRTAEDACGACPSCRKWEKLAHPDVHFVFPFLKRPKKEVCNDFLPEWRELLMTMPYFEMNDFLDAINASNGQPVIYGKESDEINKKLSLKSSEGGAKVVVFWLPEKMNATSANKLLKLIEEPPAATYFILVSNDVEKVLPTIVSRTQQIWIPPIAKQDIMIALQERYSLSSSDSEQIAHIAMGSFVKALQTIHLNEENERNFERFVGIMRASYARRIQDMRAWSEEMAASGRESGKNFLQYAQRMMRESFISNLRQGEMNYMNKPEQNFTIRFAPFINEQNIIEISEELQLAEKHIEQNVNGKMVFFDLALKLTVLLKKGITS